MALALPGPEIFGTTLTSRVSCVRLFWGIFWSLWVSLASLPLSLLVLLSLAVLCAPAGEEGALPIAHHSIRRGDFCSRILSTVSFSYSKIGLLLTPFAPSHLILIVSSIPQLRKTFIPPQNWDLWFNFKPSLGYWLYVGWTDKIYVTILKDC